MSEYQYYEFCSLTSPISSEARKEMHSLSSRANVCTHGASYTYNYGDFKGNPKKLLLKHFDVFFYISNWGNIRLMFKYDNQKINWDELKKHSIKHVIDCEISGENILLDVNFNSEDGFGWVEGEDMLSDLLPLYEEIRSGDYSFLHLIASLDGNGERSTDPVLTEAQEAFIKYAEVG